MALKGRPVQNFVPIKEIQNGVVVLKDGGIRAILMASSINLALKSADEQEATIMQFQNFLNVLEFSIQVYVQSRKLDIRPYVSLLESRIKEQTSDLMKIQTHEYSEFVQKFVEDANIMTKTFYVVVPYQPSITSQKNGGLGGILGLGKNKKNQAQKLSSIDERRSQLEQRVGIVEQGLSRTGVRTAQLGTEEIIELFYKIFNPSEVDKPMAVGESIKNN